MKPSDVIAALTALIPTRRPLFLHSSPGVGKSSLVRQVADSLSFKLVDVRATLLDPVDLRGVPRIKGDRAEWCPPVFLPADGEGILFLDELPQAPPMVQTACMQLVLDRRLGEYELPEKWVVVAAGNRTEDRAGAHRMITPLLNRFIHLDVEVSADDWQAWAVANAVAPEVRAFLRFRPALLFQFDPSTNPRAFPTPRSWSFVSDALPVTPDALVHSVVAGCVGEGAAAEFAGFLRLYRELPDLDAVLASPDSSPVPRDPSVLYALVGALVEVCRRDNAPLNNFVRYALRLPDEFALLSIRDALAVNQALITLPSVQKWIAQARQKGLFLAA